MRLVQLSRYFEFRFAFRDICTAFGAQVHPYLEKQTINDLLQEGRRSKTHKTKQVATWATKELRKFKQSMVGCNTIGKTIIESACVLLTKL